MEDFAMYILNEQDYIQKMIIAYYMSKRTGIFFDKSIILRTQIAKMFINYASLDVDMNEVLTAMLLCNCKKIDNSQKLGKMETYAKEGADYLFSLGFDKRFCKICEGLNRYSGLKQRCKESDILEVVDQFSALILKRVERDAFTPKEALVVLKERNLKNIKNRYLEDFIIFVNAMEDVNIRDSVEVPVLRKLAFLTEREKSVKSFIAKLGNRYAEEIDRLMKVNIKKQAQELLYNNIIPEKQETKSKNKVTDAVQETKKKLQTAHRYTRKIHRSNAERSLFSKEAANRIMNHESLYRID